MHIMTKDGWRQMTPETFRLPGHVPSLLEREGITKDYNGVKAFADYANQYGNAVYFTFYADGSVRQTKPAIHPLPGMY